MSSIPIKASANWGEYSEPLEKGWNKNPIEKTVDGVNGAVDSFNKMVEVIEKVINWFKNIKENISELTIDLLTGSYSLITDVVLHTPLFLFDNTWFKENIVTFTGLSLVMVIILSMYEGIQRILSNLIGGKKSHPHTDMLRISKRLPIALFGSAIAPLAFFYGFKAINGLTSMILDIGKINMEKGIEELKFDSVTWLEIIAFLGFDIALIIMLIPVFLQNFRRWFDLIALGMLTPLALGCWMFKSLEHYFYAWWEHIKKCSLTQLSYGVFIVIIGTLMFGFKAPSDFMGLLIKVGVIIGGLWRMSSPPQILGRNIDRGNDITDIWNGAKKSLAPTKGMKKTYSALEKGGDKIYERVIPKYIKGGTGLLFGKRRLK